MEYRISEVEKAQIIQWCIDLREKIARIDAIRRSGLKVEDIPKKRESRERARKRIRNQIKREVFGE